jgi:hypothetical protein
MYNTACMEMCGLECEMGLRDTVIDILAT